MATLCARAHRAAVRATASARAMTTTTTTTTTTAAASDSRHHLNLHPEDEVVAASMLTSSQRATRRALLALTSAVAGAYIAYFTTPLLADGSARSCAALTRSNDGFLSRTGTERARAMWRLGDVARAREALLAAGIVEACVDVIARGREMELEARERASVMLATATEDARGVADLRSRDGEMRALETWASSSSRRSGALRWWFRDDDDVDEGDAVAARRAASMRANVAAALERARAVRGED